MTDSYRVLWEEMTGAFAHLRRCVEATPGCSRADLCILLGQYITAEEKWLAERPILPLEEQLPKEGIARCPTCGFQREAQEGIVCSNAFHLARPPCDAFKESSASIDRLDVPLSAWPIPDVLERLADAVDHLRSGHDCDAHGHEGWLYAAQAARAHAKILRTQPVPEGTSK